MNAISHFNPIALVVTLHLSIHVRSALVDTSLINNPRPEPLNFSFPQCLGDNVGLDWIVHK